MARLHLDALFVCVYTVDFISAVALRIGSVALWCKGA